MNIKLEGKFYTYPFARGAVMPRQVRAEGRGEGRLGPVRKSSVSDRHKSITRSARRPLTELNVRLPNRIIIAFPRIADAGSICLGPPSSPKARPPPKRAHRKWQIPICDGSRPDFQFLHRRLGRLTRELLVRWKSPGRLFWIAGVSATADYGSVSPGTQLTPEIGFAPNNAASLWNGNISSPVSGEITIQGRLRLFLNER